MVKKILLYGIGIVAILALAYRTFQRPAETTGTEETKQPAYNLILISIDTVRADYLQVYNPQGAPTPNLNGLAKNGFLFTNAIAQVPFTLPSHSTMLTGTYPMKHRVQENVAAKLKDEAVTLAEVLKTRGYQTAGFIGALVLESGTGMEQGFDTFDDSFVREDRLFEDRSGVQKDAATVKRSFVRWLDQRNTASPFFSFLHFYDPHAPYQPPPPFLPNVHEPKELYRGELQYVDSVIGEIIQEISRRQLLNQTIVVVTGDHGEMLGEHAETGHGFFIYQEAVRIPLLISMPDQKSGKSDAVLGLVDLMPTVLELLSIPVPESVQGKSFAPVMKGRKATTAIAYSESLTAAQHFGAAPLRAIQDSRYKYIDSPQPELYDLRADGAESNNIAGQNKELTGRMKTSLQELLRKNSDTTSPPSERELSPEQQEELAALGYIAPSSVADTSDSKLDAKDYISSWNDLGMLSTLVKEPNCRECLPLVEKIRSRGVLPVQAKIFAARAYAGLNDYPKAISILQEITSDDPRNAQAQMALALTYKKNGDRTAALAIYKKLIDDENSVLGLENYAEVMIGLNKKAELKQMLDQWSSAGKFDRRHESVLGEIYLLLQQPEQARRYLTMAMEASPENPSNYIHLSALLDAEGKTQEAIKLLESNRGRFQNADYLLQLGKFYGKLGASRNEYEVFKEMVELHPNDSRGYFFLGKVFLEQHGDMQQVIRLAEKGLSLQPDPEYLPFGYFLLGDAYTLMGETAKAQPYLKKAQELQSRVP